MSPWWSIISLKHKVYEWGMSVVSMADHAVVDIDVEVLEVGGILSMVLFSFLCPFAQLYFFMHFLHHSIHWPFLPPCLQSAEYEDLCIDGCSNLCAARTCPNSFSENKTGCSLNLRTCPNLFSENKTG
ncbi:hypothetical protein GOP47_0003469 [Adiantum capillus-veneris]|uniref:Uncharacterized protein n=1 Tax=Adiantum capillus-veneris TaxID=13818 RepID=A0A9D4ZRW1_ADICA|nr:hypothetical protein GOP47_0003469 [Adiantum capillus-veneris]